MTKKEYATKDDLNDLWAWILIFIIIIVVIGISIHKVIEPEPTLTQLAEAEGWEVECVNKTTVKYDVAGYGKDWEYCYSYLIGFSTVTGEPIYSEILCEKECITYALRKHE